MKKRDQVEAERERLSAKMEKLDAISAAYEIIEKFENEIGKEAPSEDDENLRKNVRVPMPDRKSSTRQVSRPRKYTQKEYKILHLHIVEMLDSARKPLSVTEITKKVKRYGFKKIDDRDIGKHLWNMWSKKTVDKGEAMAHYTSYGKGISYV